MNKIIKRVFYVALFTVCVSISSVAISKNVPEKSAMPTSKSTSSTISQNQVVTTPSNPDGYINGHGYVDLGLSVKWATCNVGATDIGGYGGFFAFGETETKPMGYTSSTSKTWNKPMGDISENSIYDTAFVNWGDSWRMPTKQEMEELINKCGFRWINTGGSTGWLVIGPNNKAIFLPASGEFFETTNRGLDKQGNYWCSIPSENPNYAFSMNFSYDNMKIGASYRFLGFSVRPVSE